MTIDTKSAVSFGTLKYANIIAGNGLKVVIAGQGDVFGQAIIHSRSVGGLLLVSRAKITLNSDTLVQQFSAPEAVKKAIDSYGVDNEKLLEPGSSEQPKPAPIPAIAMVSSVISPANCATFKIIDNSEGKTYLNRASLSTGTSIKIVVEPKEGYSVDYSPKLVDPNNYEVVGDITFNVTGTPTM